MAVVHRSHSLAAFATLSKSTFEDATYVSYSRVVEEGLDDELLFRPTRRGPAHFVLAETVEAILDLVSAGVGFSILSRWALPDNLNAVVVLPLIESGARVMWSIVRREHEKSAPTLSLCEDLRESFASGLDFAEVPIVT